jgi:hypothetical protein
VSNSTPTQARFSELGASAGAGAIASLAALGALWVAFVTISDPNLIKMLPVIAVLGACVALPAFLISIAAGALCGRLAGLLSPPTSLPAFAYPLTLAILIYPFTLLSAGQSILWTHDMMQGVIAGHRTVFDARSWNQIWPLVPVMLVLTVGASFWSSSRNFAIPITAYPRWWRSLDDET